MNFVGELAGSNLFNVYSASDMVSRKVHDCCASARAAWACVRVRAVIDVFLVRYLQVQP